MNIVYRQFKFLLLPVCFLSSSLAVFLTNRTSINSAVNYDKIIKFLAPNADVAISPSLLLSFTFFWRCLRRSNDVTSTHKPRENINLMSFPGQVPSKPIEKQKCVTREVNGKRKTSMGSRYLEAKNLRQGRSLIGISFD